MKKLLSALLIIAVAGGCYNTYQLPSAELYKLDGYREGQTVQLISNEGEAVPFTQKSTLSLQATDGAALRTSFSQVGVQGSTMIGVVRGNGTPVNIDLSQIANAEVKNTSVGKTVGLAVGLGVGIPAVILTVVLVAAALSVPTYDYAF